MSSQYRIVRNNKEDPTNPIIESIKGTRFTMYIENVATRFFVHKDVLSPFGIRVSHLESGMGVTDITQSERMAALNDDVAAAKMAVENLIKRVGAPRVRSVIAGAKPLPKR